MTRRAITGMGRLWTGAPDGVIADATVVLEDETIRWVGATADLPADEREGADEVIEVDGALVTPGLIDAHTHPVYLAPRLDELAARSAGLEYRDLEGDAGIVATVRSLRGADPDEVESRVGERLRAWLRAGVTTVEAKTGYHLEREGEIAAVGMLTALRSEPDVPDLHVTFLAAHAVPPERHGDVDAYVDEASGWSDEAAVAGADSCDVFCDAGYFSPDQARRILTAGRRAGLLPRIHADELERTGGAQLAAELGCASADHLLRIEASDAAALGRAGVVATLCPTTALAMGARPDVGALREAGVRIALGSDHNPGASGLTSMVPVIALAVWELGLSVDEALTAATVGGAAALQVEDRGAIVPGVRADLVVWAAEHEAELVWGWEVGPLEVWRAGAPVLTDG